MKENNITALNKRVEIEPDPLQTVLRDGARKMLAAAIVRNRARGILYYS